MTMERSYQIDPRDIGGWKLTLWEDGEEAGGGACDDDEGYDDLVNAGEAFAGIEQSGYQP
jgi:hypothetical protein